MILNALSLISALNMLMILLVHLASTSCQSGEAFITSRVRRDDTSSQQNKSSQLNITQLLFDKFYHLVQDNPDYPKKRLQEQSPNLQRELESQSDTLTTHTNKSFNENSLQATLETRKIDQDLRQGNYLHSDEFFHKRNYFKILNRVFSRVDLPEVYKAARLRGGHCGHHIGCVEEIPNFPSLLKKANVSSSFTVYTRENSKLGHKVLFEPIIHHQLQDANTTETEVYEKLKNQEPTNNHLNTRLPYHHHHHYHQFHHQPILGVQHQQQKRQTAISWRTAAKIIHSQEYPFDLASLEQSGFNSSLNTRIIVGGYFAKEDEEWIDEVVKQWLLLEPGNIIKVSWADANRGLYHTAAYNSRIVGRQLTLFLYYLDQIFHINLDRIHLVGHSLGAHIAGFVGSDNDGKIARITGLDPAGPIFVELNASMRLDPSDAKFVDVVHTNGGTITKGALGLSVPSGHVDYYCNGGSQQPGCYFSSVTKSIMDPVERVACSHRRSYRYFIEIIKLAISEMPTSNTIQTGEINNNYLLTNRDSDCVKDSSCSQSDASKSSSHLPRAFLFEAKHDDLVRLMQPEVMLMSNSMRRDISDLAPLKRRLEFHLLNPEWPSGKRGMYFFRTRSESPFFATKQYALVLKTDTVIRRKIAIMAKIDQTLVAEAELDEIPGIYTLVFAPNDPRIMNISDDNRVPQLFLMWKYRSFNLLLNQQNELHLSGLELNLLDSDEEQPVIKYTTSQILSSLPQVSLSLSLSSTSISSALAPSSSSSGLLKSGFSGEMALTRNQWYKFEGRLLKSSIKNI